MSDFVVVGTDTDAGKTTFSALFLSGFPEQFEYWKPIETGPSDTARVRELCSEATIHESYARFQEPVAPPLAARSEGRSCPPASVLASATPSTQTGHHLLIETYGSPLSPLNDTELQIELIKLWNRPCVLVGSSSVGAIGRILQSLRVLSSDGVPVIAVILLGDPDEYAELEIAKHAPGVRVFSLRTPLTWDRQGFVESAVNQAEILRAIRDRILHHNPPASSKKIDQHDWQRLVSDDQKWIWHPYTSLRTATAPLPIVAAEKEFLITADGRRMIDAISSWWTILHGHRFPPLMNALHDAANRLDHVLFAGITHPDAVKLAELVLKTAPWPNGRVFYSDNGSTAVEVALKMAYLTWLHRGESQRQTFVSFEHAYHGDTFGAMSVGRDPLFFGAFEPLLFKTVQLRHDPRLLDDYLAKHGSQVAGVILEPLVQGAGGMKMHSAETLKGISDVARKHGQLLIADEVMTANRTGSRWAFQQACIQPDLICASKTLAGGIMPLALTMACPDIVSMFDNDDRTRTFFHGHSFTAHPMACAVAVRNEELVQDESFHRRVREIGILWERELCSLREHPFVADVRICGSIVAVDLRIPGGYLAKVSEFIRGSAIQQGVLLRPLGNVIYAMPPIGCQNRSLEQIAQVIRICTQEAAKMA